MSSFFPYFLNRFLLKKKLNPILSKPICNTVKKLCHHNISLNIAMVHSDLHGPRKPETSRLIHRGVQFLSHGKMSCFLIWLTIT